MKLGWFGLIDGAAETTETYSANDCKFCRIWGDGWCRMANDDASRWLYLDHRLIWPGGWY
jgi:hypothetical protein